MSCSGRHTISGHTTACWLESLSNYIWSQFCQIFTNAYQSYKKVMRILLLRWLKSWVKFPNSLVQFETVSTFFGFIHCKRISCHIVHLAHQLLHLRTSESMILSLESLAFHILHLHIQFEDFSFLMVDLGLCFLHIRK